MLLGFFLTFWAVLRVLMRSHSLWAILNGSWRFWGVLSHWDFLKCSEAFSLRLSCSKGSLRFWRIVWRSGMFGGVLRYLISYEQFCIAPKSSEVFYNVLGSSEDFRGIFIGSKRFWESLKVLRHSSEVLAYSEASQHACRCSERF